MRRLFAAPGWDRDRSCPGAFVLHDVEAGCVDGLHVCRLGRGFRGCVREYTAMNVAVI
ncbi:MAG: hypothetical protein K2P73_17940 [Lachnospiraceae bacterium]|nr:hypothetical protein [Lachnospiraceae bacterium]